MAVGTTANIRGKKTRILNPSGTYNLRDLYDIYDELDEGSIDQVQTGISVVSVGSEGASAPIYQNKDTFGTLDRNADKVEGSDFRQSILGYDRKKKEVAATRRAGYTSASSVLGGGAL